MVKIEKINNSQNENQEQKNQKQQQLFQLYPIAQFKPRLNYGMIVQLNILKNRL